MNTERRASSSSSGRERGQVLVIVAAGMTILIAMVGLVIDVGHGWGQQRETQNAADAAAKAGAMQVQRHYASEVVTSGDVGCAVEDSAAENQVELDTMVYTDFEGDALVPEMVVADCGTGGVIPEEAQGVRVVATQTFDTFLAGVIGVSEMTSRAAATAIVGTTPGICPAESGCGALPVTFPQNFGVCDDTEATYTVEKDTDGVWQPYELVPEGAPLNASNLAVIPLCDVDSPGSVGWLDFDCGSNLQDEVGTPCNEYIPIPDWLKTQTGNINSAEDEMRTHTGDVPGTPANEGVTIAQAEDEVLLLPIHTKTCDIDPGDQDYCPPSPAIENQWKGQGDNLYYYVDLWIGFKIDAAYMSGGDVECKSPNTQGQPILDSPVPAGKVGCLKGWITGWYSAPGGIEAADLTPGQPVPLKVGLVN